MIGQYVSNSNKSATLSILQIFLKLNEALYIVNKGRYTTVLSWIYTELFKISYAMVFILIVLVQREFEGD
jgi:hypothetical protein